MRTIEIVESNKTFYIPSDLSECSPKEYTDFCGHLFNYIIKQISFEELKVHVVYKFLNMTPVDENIPKQQEQQKLANINMIADLIEDFFEEIDENKIVKLNFLRNPIPSFKPLWKTYYGPKESLGDVTFGEYLDALRLFYQFNTDGNIEHLFSIAAILYRPKKSWLFIKKRLANYDNEIRQPYNPGTVEKRAKAMRYAPIGFLYGVYLFIASFQKIISTVEIEWGGRKLDFSVLYQTDPDDQLPDIGKEDVGMDAIMFTMAESGVFGSPTELRKTKLWYVLVRMYDSKVNYLKEKKLRQNDTTE